MAGSTNFVWVMSLIVIGAWMVGNFNKVRKPEKKKRKKSSWNYLERNQRF